MSKLGGGCYMELASPYHVVTSKITITSSPELGMAALSHPLYNPKQLCEGFAWFTVHKYISIFSIPKPAKLYFTY